MGVYKVEEKDPDHVSRSYSNSFGEPAWMPWAMRIYDHVWIHAGDVTGPKCSHGCIILPVDPAQEVYRLVKHGHEGACARLLGRATETCENVTGLASIE